MKSRMPVRKTRLRPRMSPARPLIGELVHRGIERGDIRADATGPLLVEVIPALMMYRAKVCGSEWADEEIAEMIDGVMLPLLRV